MLSSSSSNQYWASLVKIHRRAFLQNEQNLQQIKKVWQNYQLYATSSWWYSFPTKIINSIPYALLRKPWKCLVIVIIIWEGRERINFHHKSYTTRKIFIVMNTPKKIWRHYLCSQMPFLLKIMTCDLHLFKFMNVWDLWLLFKHISRT